MPEASLEEVDADGDLVIAQLADGTVTSMRLPGGTAFGWRANQLAEVSLAQLIHPDDRVIELRGRSWCIATGASQVVNVRVRTPGGRWQWYETAIDRVEIDDQSVGTVSTLRDISEIALSQEALSMVIGLRDAIDIAVDVDEALTESAQRISRFLGFDRAYVWRVVDSAPVLVASVGDVAAPPTPDEPLDSAIVRASLERTPVHIPTRPSRDLRAQREQPVNAYLVPMVSRGESIAVFEFETATPPAGSNVIALLADVMGQIAESVRRKGVDVQLDIARQQIGLAFSEAPIGMAFVSLDGRLLQVNRALCELLERPPAELQTLRFQDITHPDDVDVDVRNLNEILAGKRDRYQLEKRYIRPDSSTLWAVLSVSVVRDPGGEPLHFIGQVVDISDQKSRQFQLASRQPGALVDGISPNSAEAVDTFLRAQRCAGIPNGLITIRLRFSVDGLDADAVDGCFRQLQAMTRANDYFVQATPNLGLIVVSALSDDNGEADAQLSMVARRIESQIASGLIGCPGVELEVSSDTLSDRGRLAEILAAIDPPAAG